MAILKKSNFKADYAGRCKCKKSVLPSTSLYACVFIRLVTKRVQLEDKVFCVINCAINNR